jgi:hypothetical protein
MRLWPDLLFTSGREVSGHVNAHCQTFQSLLPA